MKDNGSALRFFIIGEKLHTTNCIWCGVEGPLSDSHLFPRSMGGRLSTRTTCKDCNNFLGRSYESAAKKNAFITAAIAKLGLQIRKEAFRFAKKEDTETGAEMRITDKDEARPVEKLLEDGKHIGTPEENKAHAIRLFQKLRPYWSTKPLEEFYDDPTRKTFTRAGLKFTKSTYGGGLKEMKLSELTRDPSSHLIFKVVYEWVALNGFYDMPLLRKNIFDMVTVNVQSREERIVLNEEVRWRTSCNTSNCFREYRRLEDIEFRPYHAVVMRLTPQLNLYVEVKLFGQLRCFYAIGRTHDRDDRIILLLDNCFVFPFAGKDRIVAQRYRNLKEPIHTQWADAAVDSTLFAIEQERNRQNGN